MLLSGGGGGGGGGRRLRRLVRSQSRHKIILHLDSLREKAIKKAFVIAEGI